MTAVEDRPQPSALSQSIRARGGVIVSATVTPTGRVIVHRVVLTAVPDEWGRLVLYPAASTETTLGRVDPDDPGNWAHAQAILRRAGYRVASDWTTINRTPVVILARADETSPGTVPGGN